MAQEYKYFAFISYNSKDMAWGRRVQRKLERYRMPAELCSKRGWKRTPIAPIFFAPTDIQGGGLSAELQGRLQAARNLIVICSPNSAKSEWVGKEIKFFHELGRTDSIHFFIVDGIPHSGDPDTECFNKVVEELGIPEILGNNIHEKIYSLPWLNRERAYVQLISKLLGVEYDSIWQRHKRMLIQRVIAWTLGVLLVVAALVGVWLTNQPVSVVAALSEASVRNDSLPALHDAVVTLQLDGEQKTDTIRMAGGEAVFANVPQRYIGKEVRMTVRCSGFHPVDTVLAMQRKVRLSVYRDAAIYGKVRFLLWDTRRERPLANTPLIVAGETVRSDVAGRVALDVPLTRQRMHYAVEASGIRLMRNWISVPCGENDIIRTKP